MAKNNNAEDATQDETTQKEEKASQKEVKAAEKEEKAAKRKERTAMMTDQVKKTRNLAARIVWLLCVFFASVLALGALCVALDFNRDNSLVSFLLNTGDAVDLGVFSRKGGIKDFTGSNADVKNILLNWGVCAVVWLVIGRVADRLIRP